MNNVRFVQVLDKALTEKEVVQNYNKFKHLFESDLVREKCETLLEENARIKKINKLLDE